MLSPLLDLDHDTLFNHHAYGQTAEQQLAELPEPQNTEALKHQAVLANMAHQGRLARNEILRRYATGEFADPQHVQQADAIQQQSQEEQDRQIVQGLSTGQLVIASPEDEQRLTNNANARAKFRSSRYLDDEQRSDLIAQTYADDASIRRAAVPISPEQRGRSPDLQKQKLIAAMPPEARDKPWQYDPKKGVLEMPRGYTEPDANAEQSPERPEELPWVDQPVHAEFSVPPEKVPDQPQQPAPQQSRQPEQQVTPKETRSG